MEPIDSNPNSQTQTPSAPPQPTIQLAQSSPTTKKRFPKIVILTVLLLLLTVSGAAGYFVYQNSNQTSQQIACTTEAMVCPDGSSVGRTGPNCEFAPCPTVKPTSTPLMDTSNWNLYANEEYRYEHKYPTGFKITSNGDHSNGTQYVTVFSDHNTESQPNTTRYIHTGLIINPAYTVEELFTDPQYRIELLEKVTLGEHEFWNGLGQDRTSTYYTQRDNGDIYWFRLQAPFEDQALLQTLAASLKFTEKNASSTIPWSEAVNLINNCEVETAFQTHALEVTLTLKDGSQVTTKEPAIDEIFAVIKEAEDTCGPILIATE